mmetsp:Transcript_41913/g.50266  ORF Transcript_41913/g.50266 Transcript_41913/m.50266 type:complete len:188 (-) Transcript_41913:496-1059(-)
MILRAQTILTVITFASVVMVNGVLTILRQPRIKHNCIETNTAYKRTTLKPNDFICSENDIFRFGMTVDGTLALLENDEIMWSAPYMNSRPLCSIQNGCVTSEGPFLQIQLDGNMAVYSNDLVVLWSTESSGKGNTSVTMNNDGSVVLVEIKSKTDDPEVLWTLIASRRNLCSSDKHIKTILSQDDTL